MRLDETFLPFGFVPVSQPSSDSVRVADLQQKSLVAGPGVRSVVWVAGCHRRCPGCMKPEWFDFSAGGPVAVGTLVKLLLGVDGTDGVSISGGEPFEQAAALAEVARGVRAAGRTVLIYTGYRHEFLRDRGLPAHRDLLSVTDILIDGEYRAEIGGAGGWRGSANQRVLALTPMGRHTLQADTVTGSPRRDVQVEVTGGGIRVTGCPDSGFMHRFAQQLAARGIILTPSSGGGRAE